MQVAKWFKVFEKEECFIFMWDARYQRFRTVEWRVFQQSSKRRTIMREDQHLYLEQGQDFVEQVAMDTDMLWRCHRKNPNTRLCKTTWRRSKKMTPGA